MSKTVIITQSNYIPWKGYFDALNYADEFILFDEMQYTRRDWRNRNKIVTEGGVKWISIPVLVKGKYHQSINKTRVSDSRWGIKHWSMIKANYSRAPFFKVYKDVFQELYLNNPEVFLSKINEKFIVAINQILRISTKISRCEDYQLVDGKTERLVDLCLKARATEYLTGPMAKAYLDESLFSKAGISVHWLDYSGYPEYPQVYGEFEHGVTILDLLFNTGPDAREYMKSF